MYDPSMRVLTVLEILQAKGTATTEELVGRLEVSERTVQRYIARLQDLGVPVTATRGRGAAYSLARGFRMQPLMFNDEEALAVALGLKALQQLGITSLVPAVSGVETKLERTLPDAIWRKVNAINKTLHLNAETWMPAADTAIIGEVAYAIQARLEVVIQYVNRRQEASERMVRPLGLVRDGGSWFMAAYCLMRQGLRLFRVDRIQSVKVTQTPFESAPDFEMQDFLESSFENLPAMWKTEVWVHATFETLNYAMLPARAKIEPEGNGIVIRCSVNHLEEFAAMLLALSCPVEIRAPEELRAAFGAVAQRAFALAKSTKRSITFDCE